MISIAAGRWRRRFYAGHDRASAEPAAARGLCAERSAPVGGADAILLGPGTGGGARSAERRATPVVHANDWQAGVGMITIVPRE